MRSASLLPLFLAVAVQGQQWVQLADFPGTERDDAAVFSIGENVFVGTGMEVGWGLTNDWYRYDVAGNEWSPIAPLPASPRQYCAAFHIGGKGYLFGGLDASGPLHELWEYDPLSDAWTQRAALPGPGRYAMASFIAGLSGYVVAGLLADGSATNETWRYQPSDDTWTACAPLPGVPRHRAMGFSDWHVVVGGADASYQALSDGHIYDPGNDSWSPSASLPEARFGAATASTWGMFVIGGASSLTVFHEDVYLFVPGSGANTWTAVNDPFNGGPRRGAVGASRFTGGSPWIYCGLGLSGATRLRDWWGASLPLDIAEPSIGRLEVFPNPASDLLWVLPAHHHATSSFTVHDPTGRTVMTGHLRHGTPLELTALPAGRYELRTHDGDLPLRAPFIKLP